MDGFTVKSEAVEKVVKELEVTRLDNIGRKEWFKNREKLLKLYQLTMLQAKTNQEEIIKVSILENNKLSFFVHEIITISVWREMIFPEMLKLTPVPEHTFPTYMILYHEGMLVGLLQMLLFHSDICISLSDSANDVIDYAVSQLLRLDSKQNPPDKNKIKHKNSLEALKFQSDIISFNIGAQCLSILRYVSENLGDLPLSVSTNIYSNHDVPLLVTYLINNSTWCQEMGGYKWKFSDTSWREWFSDDPPLSTTECQTWLLLYQLLTHPNCSTSYELTSHRKEQLSKLGNLLHDNIIDMLSPLKHLRYSLNEMSISCTSRNIVNKSLVIEMETKLREELYSTYKNSFRDLAVERAQLLFYGSQEEIQELAKSMAGTFEMMEEVSNAIRTCHNCYLQASKKCSKCKRVWYCSRECQVQHWNAHKNICCK